MDLLVITKGFCTYNSCICITQQKYVFLQTTYYKIRIKIISMIKENISQIVIKWTM